MIDEQMINPNDAIKSVARDVTDFFQIGVDDHHLDDWPQDNFYS